MMWWKNWTIQVLPAFKKGSKYEMDTIRTHLVEVLRSSDEPLLSSQEIQLSVNSHCSVDLNFSRDRNRAKGINHKGGLVSVANDKRSISLHGDGKRFISIAKSEGRVLCASIVDGNG